MPAAPAAAKSDASGGSTPGIYRGIRFWAQALAVAVPGEPAVEQPGRQPLEAAGIPPIAVTGRR